MKNIFLRCVLLAAMAAAIAAPALAGELKLTMQGGRVTLIADNVPIRQILQEWARVGQTRIVNADKISGPNLTLQLLDVPERDALDVILRSASGYIAAPRATTVADAAVYDRITIFMATTHPPPQVVTAAPPPSFQRPPQPDDSDEPINVQMPPQMINPAANGQPMPGMPPNIPPQVQQQLQQMQMQQMQQQQQQGPQMSPVPGPLTSPRPGAMPMPAGPGVTNPYQPVPIRPGGGGGGN
jgi:hypothetical protein